MSNAKMEIKYVGPAAAEQLISNINNALDTKQPKGDYVSPGEAEELVNSSLNQAKESGDFKGDPGVGITSVTISFQGDTESGGNSGAAGSGIVYIYIEEV